MRGRMADFGGKVKREKDIFASWKNVLTNAILFGFIPHIRRKVKMILGNFENMLFLWV